MKTIETDYQKQANDFLTKCNVKMDVVFVKHDKYFPEDKEKRDIYIITLTKGGRKESFEFGASLNKSGKYIILDRIKAHKLGSNKVQEKKDALNKGVNYRNVIPNKDFSGPTAYDLLTCLTKYEVGTFDDFCANFGYDTDSRKAEKTYKAVCEEYKKVCCIFSDDELTELQEIN
jgi:hypothetical protein